MTIKQYAAAGLAALSLAALGVGAQASEDETLDAAMKEKVALVLAEAGYTLDEAEVEDGVIEVDATRDGEEWELTLDAETGAILSEEKDD